MAVPQRIPLRRQWTSNKLQSLAFARNADLGKRIFIAATGGAAHLSPQVSTFEDQLFADYMQGAINCANFTARFRFFIHNTGKNPHRSTVAVHDKCLMERRHYLNSNKIEWFPI
jgi:hypothetical protein